MATTPTRVLVVAHKTAATRALAEAVAARVAAGPCTITLLVPAAAAGLHCAVDPEDQCCAKAEAVIAEAVPMLEAPAGCPVDALVGSHDPLAAVEDALNLRGFDEVIVSTLGTRGIALAALRPAAASSASRRASYDRDSARRARDCRGSRMNAVEGPPAAAPHSRACVG